MLGVPGRLLERLPHLGVCSLLGVLVLGLAVNDGLELGEVEDSNVTETAGDGYGVRLLPGANQHLAHQSLQLDLGQAYAVQRTCGTLDEQHIQVFA